MKLYNEVDAIKMITSKVTRHINYFMFSNVSCDYYFELVTFIYFMLTYPNFNIRHIINNFK